MTIQWYGHSCFKISTKPEGRGSGEDVVIFTDPYEPSIGLRPPQGGADIVTISHSHPDHNNPDALRGEPAVLDLPGEYSIKSISITGVESEHDKAGGAEHGKNVIFVIESEGIRFCHLGNLGTPLDKTQLEEVDGVDILAVSVGEAPFMTAKDAKNWVDQIDPRIILPMHYKIPGLKLKIGDEKNFCKEIGTCPREKTARMVIKKKDLEGMERKIVLMEALSL